MADIDQEQNKDIDGTVWYFNGKPLSEVDKKSERIEAFFRKHCSGECVYEHTCNKQALLDISKCGFKPAYREVWCLVDPANAVCKDCGLLVFNDDGFCPVCRGETRRKWKKVWVMKY